MKLKTTTDIHQFLRIYVASVALGTALEHRLFWRLAEAPASAIQIAEELGIPFYRCRCWLELLKGLGLLERQDETYIPSSVARAAILETYTSESWALVAKYAQEWYPLGNDLTQHMSHPESVWVAQGLKAPDYINQIREDPERARQFTQVLYEIHKPLAEHLVAILDMSGVTRLLDVGGGSGVMSLALLHHYPNLTAVVVDLENVCQAGREIAAQTPMASRIIYHAADFVRQELPMEFDMILECDVGIYTEALFRKLRAALNPKGRLVIVDWIRQPGREPTLQWLNYEFVSTLGGRKTPRLTREELRELLVRAGYRRVTEQTLKDPIIHEVQGVVGPVILQAHK